MTALRAFLREHTKLAALLVAMALLMRALVPAGYMPSATPRHFIIQICADATGQPSSATLAIPASHSAPAKDSALAKAGAMAGGHCAFAALAAPGLAGAGAAVLAIALAAMLRLALAPRPAPIQRLRRQIRPPLRGPPAGR